MLRSSGMSSHCVVPYWNNQRQEQAKEDLQEEERNITSNHVQNHQSMSSTTHNITTSTITNVVPKSNYQQQQVKELTWENGEIAMHGLLPVPQSPSKPIWAQTGGTLESIVHQATKGPNNNVTWKWAHGEPILRPEKRKRAESDNSVAKNSISRNSDTTMITWASFESPPSFQNKISNDDLASHGCLENREDEPDMRDEVCRSNCSKRSRVASVHNQSERRRRDRINQKMKALQKLVPNSSKSDKASMLDEVIEYLKQLQAQVQLMSSVRVATPQIMMQMSMLAAARMRMEMGMGMGMVDTARLVPSPFMMVPPNHSHQPKLAEASSSSSSLPLPDPYCAILAQSMNMDFYNNMAALYAQQLTQPTQSTPSWPTQLQAE